MRHLISRGQILDLCTPQIMGVLNVTNDSFVVNSRVTTADQALDCAQEMCKAGATIIDLGGQATHPSAQPISEDEELNRVMPIVEKLCRNLAVWVSIDTYYPEVMRCAIAHGAHLVNDIHALQSPGALELIAQSKVAVCLMHAQPHHQPVYPDPPGVLGVVHDYLTQRAEKALAIGIDRASIMLDPGFGFGKTLTDNYRLLADLKTLLKIGFPVLMGVSRKRMVRGIYAATSAQALSGTIAAQAWGLIQGVHVIRVHDVAEAAQLRDVIALLRDSQQASLRCENSAESV